MSKIFITFATNIHLCANAYAHTFEIQSPITQAVFCGHIVRMQRQTLMNCIYHGPVTYKRTDPLQLDLKYVMQKKIGKKRMEYIPGFIIRRLEKIICIKELNEILAHNNGKTGADFATGVLEQLNTKVDVRQTENMLPPSKRRVLLVSNHPMGGPEGVAMIHFMSRYYGGQIYVVVNDILMAVEPLQNVFLPVNKHGHQGQQTVSRLDEALNSDNPVLIFPAGKASRLDNRGRVRDLPWHRAFINKAIAHKRTILPIFCCGRNSKFFYNFARVREALSIKLNIEMVRLPYELLRMRNTTMSIICGKPVDWQTLRGGRHADEDSDRIRQLVYSMEPIAQ